VEERERARVLASCALFADLGPSEVARLAAAASVERYRRGQLVFAAGDDADSLAVVGEGSLKAVGRSAEGDDQLLAVVGPMDVLGELSVIDGGARSASVVALDDATVLRVPRRTVLDVAIGSPPLLLALLTSMAAVIRRLTGAAADTVFLDIPRQVAKLVLGLPEPGSQQDVPLLTPSEMADRVGTSRQSLNAALQEFQRRGWITVAGRAITVVDASALRRYVAG
jgi:CRP/FNR family cyclic AMP-dependent transcriptional regulator